MMLLSSGFTTHMRAVAWRSEVADAAAKGKMVRRPRRADAHSSTLSAGAARPANFSDETTVRRVCVAQVGAPHGLRGEVRLRPFTAEAMALERYRRLETEDGQGIEVVELRPGRRCLIARLAGISDRSAAERLRNAKLYVPRTALPELGSDEFYHADLVGLAVVTVGGDYLGTVVALHNFGAGDIIEVRPDGGATVMLPFTAAVVPEVDIAGGRLVVDPPAGTVERR
jgi:16S rRNA processing protein RimM